MVRPFTGNVRGDDHVDELHGGQRQRSKGPRSRTTRQGGEKYQWRKRVPSKRGQVCRFLSRGSCRRLPISLMKIVIMRRPPLGSTAREMANVEQTVLLTIVKGMMMFIAESNARVAGVARAARQVVTPVVTLLLRVPTFVYELFLRTPTNSRQSAHSQVCQVAILKRLTLGSTARGMANAVPVTILAIATTTSMFTSESTAIV